MDHVLLWRPFPQIWNMRVEITEFLSTPKFHATVVRFNQKVCVERTRKIIYFLMVSGDQ
jgi:hypothetical protein